MKAATELQSLQHVIDTGRELLSELDPDALLERILGEARIATGARYAAIGVLSPDRTKLDRFLTAGIDADGQRAIGDRPHGRGVLGVLITEPQPLRLSDLSSHPQSFGFPLSHPAMVSFLGMPIMIRGLAWGNLYLTEKADGAQFSEADERSVGILAQFAATAIENARLYDLAERGRRQLARAVRGLEAARAIADAIGVEPELERVLELVVERGRDLVGARSVLILLRDRDDLIVAAVAAVAGRTAATVGRRIPISHSTSGEVLLGGVPARISDVHRDLRVPPEELGVTDAHTALLVPMSHRGERLGVLIAFDRGPNQASFSAADEELLRVLAASAANGVAISRSVKGDRLRAAVSSAEDERRRWARELHDQTLQSLGGVRVLLSGARSGAGSDRLGEAVDRAVADLDDEIGNLRAIISDLRPSILDDLGLLAALEALTARRRAGGLELGVDLRLPSPAEAAGLMSPELETTVYRVVQEALTNVVKHAHASCAWVTVALSQSVVTVKVRDDGVGFDATARSDGFGLTGIRERVYLAGGEATLLSDADGTVFRARIPTGPGSALAVLAHSDA